MYNRYYPDADGSYKKESREEAPPKPEPDRLPPEMPMNPLPEHEEEENKGLLSFLSRDLDMGDLITLFVLLTIAGDKPENRTSAILTLVFYFLL